MKNAIGAVIILFVVYLHLLVVPPRNLRGFYYKNYDAANPENQRTCNYEWSCNTDHLNGTQQEEYCGEMPSEEPETETCYGTCLTYYTTRTDGNVELFRGKRCIEYCEPYCMSVEDGTTSCFECCFGERCN